MPKLNEIPEAIRKQIVELRNEGLTYMQIAERVEVPYSTADAIVQKHRGTAAVSNLPRVGAPRKITGRSRRYLLHKVTNEPMTTRACPQKELELQGVHVSRKTVSRELHRSGVHSFTPRRTPLLISKHAKNRLTFAKDHLDKELSFGNGLYGPMKVKLLKF